MSDDNSKLNQEIDARKFFLSIFYVFLFIGLIIFLIYFKNNVYKPDEKEYVNGSRYAYSVIQKEVVEMYKEKGYVFNDKIKEDDELCRNLINKYSSHEYDNCKNLSLYTPGLNFVFKGKKIAILGLEKPGFYIGDAYVKDILIDVNNEGQGQNQVGIDRTILRIYSSGLSAGMVSPVNCSQQDEKEFDMRKSTYCIGSQELNYLIVNKPLGFDIEQIGGDNGKTKIIGKNISFIRADCSATGGDLLGYDDYCSEKMYYWLRGCSDDYTCNIVLTK